MKEHTTACAASFWRGIWSPLGLLVVGMLLPEPPSLADNWLLPVASGPLPSSSDKIPFAPRTPKRTPKPTTMVTTPTRPRMHARFRRKHESAAHKGGKLSLIATLDACMDGEHIGVRQDDNAHCQRTANRLLVALMAHCACSCACVEHAMTGVPESAHAWVQSLARGCQPQ